MSKKIAKQAPQHRGLGVRRKQLDEVISSFVSFRALQAALCTEVQQDILSLEHEISLRKDLIQAAQGIK
jgi:hypothetical protein